MIIDDLLGQGKTTARLSWHIPNFPYRVDNNLYIHTTEGDFKITILQEPISTPLQVARAASNPRLGWRSLHYGSKEPCLTAYTDLSSALPIRFITLIDLTGQGDIQHESLSSVKILEDNQLQFEVFAEPAKIKNTSITAKFANETLRI